METYFSTMSPKPGTTDQLSRDLRVLAHDAEHVLKDSCRTMGQQSRIAAERADAAIRRNPYGSMGVAFGLGLLVGFLISRD